MYGGAGSPLLLHFRYDVMTKMYLHTSCSHPRVPQLCLFALLSATRSECQLLPAFIRVRRWPARQARHRLSGASHAARPQGCVTASVEGPTGIDWKALRFGGPDGFSRPPRGERVICKPCGHVLLNDLGAARGRNEITQCVSSRRFRVTSFDECCTKSYWP